MPPANEQGCTFGKVTREKITHLEASDAKQWDVLEKLQSRLPNWATLIIAILMALIGYFVRH